MPRRYHRPVRVYHLLRPPIALLLALWLLGVGLAQTLQLSAALDSRGCFRPALRLDNLRLAGATVGISLGSSGRAPAFSVSARQLSAFGPVGNLTLRSAASFDSAGNFSATFGASGVVANTAGELELALSTLNPGALNPSELFLSDRPVLLSQTGLAASLNLGGSYRLDRSTIVRLEGGLFATTEGLAAELRGQLRRVGVVGRDDLFLRAEAYGAPGFQAGFGALGVSYDVNRADWPDLIVTALIGYGPDGLAPGGRLSLSQALFGGRLGLQLRAEPYRVGTLPYRAALSYELEVLGGRLRLEGYGTRDNPWGVAPLSGALSYQRRF